MKCIVIESRYGRAGYVKRYTERASIVQRGTQYMTEKDTEASDQWLTMSPTMSPIYMPPVKYVCIP